MNNSLELQHLVIVAVNQPGTAVRVLFGPDDISQSGGYGGWEEVPRPKRQSMTDFKGTPLFQVKIPLLFDGFAHELSVEPDLRILSHMAMKDPQMGHPPIVTYVGAAPGAGRLWVIQDIERGTYDRRSSDGQLIRQHCTVTFLEFVAPVATIWAVSGPANDAQARHDAESAAAAAAASRQAAQDANNLDPADNPAVDQGPVSWGERITGIGMTDTSSPSWGEVLAGGRGAQPPQTPNDTPSGWDWQAYVAKNYPGAMPNSYTVKSGDTLSAIAARELGDPNRWQEIADLNGIQDPRALRVGQVLQLPPVTTASGGGHGVAWL